MTDTNNTPGASKPDTSWEHFSKIWNQACSSRPGDPTPKYAVGDVVSVVSGTFIGQIGIITSVVKPGFFRFVMYTVDFGGIRSTPNGIKDQFYYVKEKDLELVSDDQLSSDLLPSVELTKPVSKDQESYPEGTTLGFWSATAAKRYGSSIYLDPNGKEVEVTYVSQNPNPDYQWPDKICVGPVTSFVRSFEATLSGNLMFSKEIIC